MIKISTLQGKIINLVESGISTVADLSNAANKEQECITSALAILRYRGLVIGSSSPGTKIRSYTATGKPYFAGQSVSESTAAIIEAIDLGYCTPDKIKAKTGLVPSAIKAALNQTVKYDLIKKRGDYYSTTGAAYWVKSYHCQAPATNKGKWALCDYLCFELPVPAGHVSRVAI